MSSAADLGEIAKLLASHADAQVKRHFAVAITLVVAAGALAALAPLMLKQIVDSFAYPQESSGFWTITTALLAGAYLLGLYGSRALTEIRPLVYGRAEQRLYGHLSRQFFRHLLDLPLEFHLNRHSGAVAHTLSQAIIGCQLLVQHTVTTIVPVLVEVVCVAAILAHLDQPALFVTLALASAAYLGVFWTSVVRLREPARAISVAILDAQAVLADSLLNYETLKYFNAEPIAHARHEKATRDIEAQWCRLYRRRATTGLLVATVFALSVAASLILATEAVRAGSLSLGGFVVVNAYMLQIVRPLEALGLALRDVAQGMAFMQPLLKVMREQREAADERTGMRVEFRPRGPDRVDFEAIDFAYDQSRTVLAGINLTIPTRRTVAVVGPSGAGKSSLVRLLLRAYEPRRGRILISGKPVSELPLASLRARIAVVPQDTILFNDTIAYNIGIGCATATRQDIERAARLAHLHDFILTLPTGYDTQVGERGLKLSGGEKQRIAIARAVLKQPTIYVFDEATASLDSRTELAILNNLREISADMTTLIIAHRLSTIRYADEIVVLEGGRIVEQGTHATLLASGGRYASLWRAQMGEIAA